MIVVSAEAPIKPELREQALEAAHRVVEATRKEPGCLRYTFYTDIADPNTFHAFEEWESPEALDAHFQTEHVKAFFAALGPALAAPPVIKRYVVESVTPL